MITWDDVPEKLIALGDTVCVGLSDRHFMTEDTAKCYSCNGWFPMSSCVLNTEDDGSAVPVCERCASGRVA